MNIVNKPLSEIIPYNKNPRKNDHAVDAVARSIKEFGFKNPILLDPRNVIICGHTRYKAAIILSLETVPCIVADDLTEKQIKAFRIADNKLSELARWDFPLLTGELADLKDLFNFEDFGFSEKELRDLIGVHDVQEDNFDIDAELKKPAVSKTGDIWLLGKHRVMCADSTIEENVKQLMDNQAADLVVTDPPYNVDYGSKADAINKYGYRFSDRHIQNDYMPELEFIDFLDKAFKNMNAVMKPGAAFYIWHASITVYEFETALRQNNLKTRQQLIWCKNSIVLGRQDYQWKHEPCLYGWKEGGPHSFVNDRTVSTLIEDEPRDFTKMKKEDLIQLLDLIHSELVPVSVIHVNKPGRSAEHPTMKPLNLLANLIINSSKRSELVLDIFGGSGSTLMAAEQLKRTCYMMEIDQKYVDVIVNRYIKLTNDRDNIYIIRDGIQTKYADITGLQAPRP